MGGGGCGSRLLYLWRIETADLGNWERPSIPKKDMMEPQSSSSPNGSLSIFFGFMALLQAVWS